MIECSMCKEWYHRMRERAIPSNHEKSDMGEWYCGDSTKNSLSIKLCCCLRQKMVNIRKYKEKVIIEVYAHCRYFSSTIPDQIFGAK